MITKIADSKGRITLGPQFANKSVIVEQVDSTEIRIIAAAVIPQRELWLHENTEVKASVMRGLRQAKLRKFSKKPPDLKRDAALAELLDD